MYKRRGKIFMCHNILILATWRRKRYKIPYSGWRQKKSREMRRRKQSFSEKCSETWFKTPSVTRHQRSLQSGWLQPQLKCLLVSLVFDGWQNKSVKDSWQAAASPAVFFFLTWIVEWIRKLLFCVWGRINKTKKKRLPAASPHVWTERHHCELTDWRHLSCFLIISQWMDSNDANTLLALQ